MFVLSQSCYRKSPCKRWRLDFRTSPFRVEGKRRGGNALQVSRKWIVSGVKRIVGQTKQGPLTWQGGQHNAASVKHISGKEGMMVPVESSSKPAFTGHQKALVLVRQADGPWREGGRVIGRETEDCQSAPSFPMAYRGRRENASRSSYIQESGFSFLKLFKGSQIHEFGVLEFCKENSKRFRGKSWGGFGAHHFFTGIVHNSRRNTAWKTVTGVGQVVLSIEPYTTQIYGNLGYFPWKCTNLSGKIWVATDSQSQRNNVKKSNFGSPFT